MLAVALGLAAAAGAGAAGSQSATDPDSRQVYSAQSPPWLQAVGKLRIPGSRLEDGRRRHLIEDCTATLIALPDIRINRWVLTAWHCLEFYADLSRPILFTLPNSPGGTISREATVIESGGAMDRDWALLRLDRPIRDPGVTPLPLSAATVSRGAVSMAGYSRDRGLGQGGEVLTYDAFCEIVAKRGRDYETDCAAFKGASGGPVVKHSQDGSAAITGIISRGNGADISIFVPITRFAAQLLGTPGR